MLRVIGAFTLLYLSCVEGGMSGSWDFTIVDSFANSTNEALLKSEMKTIRIGRGVYALSGSLDINFLVTGDVTVSVDVLRSASGVGEYTKIALAFPKQKFSEYLDNHYKNFVMPSIKDCSNMPQFEGDWTGELGDEHWQFDKCSIDKNSLQIYLQDGYYKIQVTIGNNDKLFIEILVKVESKYY